MSSDLASRLQFAGEVVRLAGAIALRHYANPNLQVDAKADQTPVTQADREIEAFLRQEIARVYPGEHIIGEEFENTGDAAIAWVIDPIDGTKSFARGVPLYGIMLAYVNDGRSMLGAIAFPSLGEYISAARGLGCRWEIGGVRREAHVSSQADLSDATLVFTKLAFEDTNLNHALNGLLPRVKVSRSWGDCYGYLLVATGRADIMVDLPKLEIWDTAPVQVIVEEAGGRFTDFAGASDLSSGTGLATNGLLHDEVLAVLNEH